MEYRQFAANLEDLEQVEELAVGVSTDSDGCAYMDHVGFRNENFFGLNEIACTF